MLDVDRALLDARAAGGAAPQDVGVDDPALLGGADQRAHGLLGGGAHDPLVAGLRARGGPCRVPASWKSGTWSSGAVCEPRMYGALANRWSRRFMISSLGDSGLPVFQAGHCDWQRPHSVQVAMSSMAVHLKSSTLPTPKVSLVRVGLLEVE